jgi:hypothetical protein
MEIVWILASSIELFKGSRIGNQAIHPYIQNGFPIRKLVQISHLTLRFGRQRFRE